MRYLTSISLALIVHVLLSIVVLMALACTAEPATLAPTLAPTATPAPNFSESEILALLREEKGSRMCLLTTPYVYTSDLWVKDPDFIQPTLRPTPTPLGPAPTCIPGHPFRVGVGTGSPDCSAWVAWVNQTAKQAISPPTPQPTAAFPSLRYEYEVVPNSFWKEVDVSYKQSGIWLVAAKAGWKEDIEAAGKAAGHGRIQTISDTCVFRVDDTTGDVMD